ncbi:hypothetical protein STRTUCAR8_04123 [Streptomyces turgidiscabies Car8]|uniref:Uncharacterized protein n=1 Tax=Streptomyces turgidiscabies (strain Car8) TaxID=698760 RepID=L7F8Z3_STRT8|nr:hypothetical protein STRTUCAR8_04123 [Streptomyces turgidiscabies Car8]GAQ76093.1 hypothetical protein T45_07882 [Streptomyces turgidiscabies]
MTESYGGCTVLRAEHDTVRGTTREEFQLLGGERVFVSVADRAHAPRAARALIASGAGGRFALAGAKCGRRLPARYGPAPEVHLAPVHTPGEHR